MEKNKLDWQNIVTYLTPYIKTEEVELLNEYVGYAGEFGIAFDFVVNCILEENIPVNKELFDWIHWYGTEAEKLGNQISSDWRSIKLGKD